MWSSHMTTVLTITFQIWLLLLAAQCSSWNIINETPPTLTYPLHGKATFLMKADTVLIGCECRTYLSESVAEPLIDLSKGRKSTVFRHKWYGARYNGTGLENGQCGIELFSNGLAIKLLICRARAMEGGWKYREAMITTDKYSKFNVSAEPLYALMKPGADTAVVFTADRALSICSIQVPSEPDFIYFYDGLQSAPHGRFSYAGEGLGDDQCALKITGVAEEDSGPIISWVKATDGSESYMHSRLIVAVPPPTSSLMLSSGNFYVEGDVLRATCTVNGSRPISSITWLLGKDIIRQDEVNDVPDPAWRWPWDKEAITQILVYTVKLKDNSKLLKCRVQHLALGKNLEESARIAVQAGTNQKIPVLPPDTTSQVTSTPPAEIKCGIKGHSSHGLIAGGNDVVLGEYPWHAGIFMKNDDDTYVQYCGGTLVTPTMIISAAHCFWNHDRTGSRLATDFKVAVGKVKRSWNVVEVGEQKRDVETIIIMPRFFVHLANLQHDIAIVKMSSPFTMTRTVNIICLDLSNSFELTAGMNGISTGWGLTENGTASALLQSVSLPWIAEDTCWESIPENTQQFFTFDKFCAGYVNESTSVCGGDSGGGLAFFNPATKRFYLGGVVSLSFAPTWHVRLQDGCYSQHYTGFTKISSYVTWIKKNK